MAVAAWKSGKSLAALRIEKIVSDNHEVDENDDNTLSIKLLKLKWIYSAKRESFR